MADPTIQVTPAVRRIFTALCVIGVPGSGKTSLADRMAVYLWETYRKVLLLYSWDGGAIPTDVQKRMRQGLIRFWRARTRSADGLGIETCYLGSKGYWPRTINPETGETAPAVDLVAPVTTSYTLQCPKGHPMGVVQHAVQIIPQFCSECKQMIGTGEYQIVEAVQRTKGFEQVGGVFFDGLTSMTKVVMDHMDIQRGAGLIGGEKPAFGGVVQSGSVKMGGNNRADVGFGQSRGEQFVNNSLSIPYLVEGPVFTALAMEATDEGGLSIVGLKLPGRAATDDASSWFGNVMEMGETPDSEGQPHVTLFLRPFTDTQGRRHLLKTSASVWGMPDMLVDPPRAAKKPGEVANLGDVFRLLDKDLTDRLAQGDVPDAPGLTGAPTTYGDPLTAAQPTAATLAATPAAQATTTAAPIATPAPQAMPARMPPRQKKAPAPAEPSGGLPPLAAAPITAASPAPPTPAQAAVVADQKQTLPAPGPPAPPIGLGGTVGTAPPPPGMRPKRAPGA